MINIIKCFYILVFCSVLFSIPDKLYCLEALSKDEMKTTTGQRALTDFSTTENTARMYINTHIETFTEIKSMKLGHYNRTGHIENWDQNWTGLDFGNSTSDPLTMDGFIIKADFVEGTLNSEDSNPELKRMIIGSNRLTGTISGDFKSFTGSYNPDLTGETSGHGDVYTRKDLGKKEFRFDSSPDDQNHGFFLILSPDTANRSGIHTLMGYTEENISDFTDNANNTTEWWDAP